MSAPAKVKQKPASNKSSRTTSAVSNRTVYLLPKRTAVVDLVLNIMDGPRPMKNMRPAQKTRNGADQFNDEHHGEYEARGQPSRNKIDRVHAHNSAFPKMYDELDKRRAIAQPAASNQELSVTSNFDRHCPLCVKLKRQTEHQRKRRAKKRSRHQPSFRVKSDTNTKSKITKPKKSQRRYRASSKVFKLSKIRTNKGCQCTSYMVPAETKSVTVSTFNDNILSVPSEYVRPPPPTVAPCITENHENYDLKSIKSPIQKCNSKPSKSDIDSGNPETNSAPSISSYNSFMSMEHEPMIE